MKIFVSPEHFDTRLTINDEEAVAKWYEIFRNILFLHKKINVDLSQKKINYEGKLNWKQKV